MSSALHKTLVRAAWVLLLAAALPAAGSDVPRVANCYPDFVPQVEFLRLERGQVWVTIWLSITNRDSFPKEFFVPAPHLPPCGLNLSSPRMWVTAVAHNPSVQMGGYCGFLNPADMQEITFGNYDSLCPAALEVLFEDRECGITYRSPLIPVPCQTALAPAAWTLVKSLYRD